MTHIISLAEAVTITPRTDIEVVRLVEAVKAHVPQIIRTVEELEALDPDTAVVSADNGEVYFAKRLTGLHAKPHFYVPAVVLIPGAQVRAAREAMEQENE